MTEQHPGDALPAVLPPVQGSDGTPPPPEPSPAAQGAPPPPVAPPAIEPTAVHEWNPLASLEETRHPIASSDGRAFVILRPWSGNERITYEDQLLVRFLVDDESGSATVRLGMMRLVGTALTLRGSEGFPRRADGSAMFTGADKARVEAELLSLEPSVYQEIRDLALRVQPLPTASVSDRNDDDDGGEGQEGDDPFQTPPTPETEAPAVE